MKERKPKFKKKKKKDTQNILVKQNSSPTLTFDKQTLNEGSQVLQEIE